MSHLAVNDGRSIIQSNVCLVSTQSLYHVEAGGINIADVSAPCVCGET